MALITVGAPQAVPFIMAVVVLFQDMLETELAMVAAVFVAPAMLVIEVNVVGTVVVEATAIAVPLGAPVAVVLEVPEDEAAASVRVEPHSVSAHARASTTKLA